MKMNKYDTYVSALEALGITVLGSAHAWADDYAERIMLLSRDIDGQYAINVIVQANGYGDELESAASAAGGIAQEAAEVLNRMVWMDSPSAAAMIREIMIEWQDSNGWGPRADDQAREEISALLSMLGA